jgi:hypothetical protein
VTFEELRVAYREQAEGLLEGGCDLFLVETIFDTLNAKAAIFALDELMEDSGERLPLIVSGTVTDASGASCPARPCRRSGTACAMPAARDRPELRARRGADAARTSPSWRGSPATPSSAATRTPGCRTR